MPCKSYLRHDQKGSQRALSSSKDVVVFAPSWVREGLKILGKTLKGIEFQVHEKPSMKRGRNASGPTPVVLDSFKITEDFDHQNLVILQKVARNEARNTNGVIDMLNYSPDIKDKTLVYSIKDLARQCVIIGKDETAFCGGYKCSRVEQKNEPVYICDLAALQFQKPYNSGRLVLIQENNDPYKGPLDDFIFERVVGEKRKTFQEVSTCKEDEGRRYIKHVGFGGTQGRSNCFFDAKAYGKFVEQDVILTGLALVDLASTSTHGSKLNFKFLKYGTGYFAGKFGDQLNSLILPAVLDGLEALFGKDARVSEIIKSVEFPFYTADSKSEARLRKLQKQYKIEFRFSRDDALKQTMKGKGLTTATTNCADTNVACGNAMGFKSTDGAIAENLVSRANIFSPNMNNLMQYKYIDM